MAPKRSAPPPPPPPPVESSVETDTGSGTDGSEELFAHSPPTAPPKKTARPSQKVQEPESSDEKEDEDEDEEEEEEGEEEEGEEEEGEEEEGEDDNANHTASASAAKNPPPPPPKPDDSESDEEEDKKLTAPSHRSWSKNDAVRILEALAAHRQEHGKLPQPEDLEAALAGSLDNSDYGCKELTRKVNCLKKNYYRTVRKGDLPSKDHDLRIFNLAKKVWGRNEMPPPPNSTSSRDFGEICEMYPYLGEELKALEMEHPGLCKRNFSLINDDKARALDQKIKKQRIQQMKLELRHHDLTKVVTKTLMDLLK